MFTQAAFDRLSQQTAEPALTIYLPTHRAGQETHNGHDAIAFKDALKDAERELTQRGFLNDRDAETFLAPLRKLVDDREFWTHQSDTLAVFATADGYETFSLPVPSEEADVCVDRQFRLAPAARMLAPEARYYVLSVTQNYTSFFEATRHSITPVHVHDLLPVNMAEVLEVYDGGETLQHHGNPVAGAGGGTTFHGQGSNEDREDERLTIYFRRINDGLEQLLEGQTEPLILACDKQHVAGLKRAIKYPHLAEEAVGVHPNALDPTALHRETWMRMQHHFDAAADELQELFGEAEGAGRTAHGLADIYPAAKGGRVGKLLLAEGAAPTYGTYDEATHSVRPAQRDDDGAIDLLEATIRETARNSGTVMFRLADQVPDQTDGASAILRYAA